MFCQSTHSTLCHILYLSPLWLCRFICFYYFLFLLLIFKLKTLFINNNRIQTHFFQFCLFVVILLVPSIEYECIFMWCLIAAQCRELYFCPDLLSCCCCCCCCWISWVWFTKITDFFGSLNLINVCSRIYAWIIISVVFFCQLFEKSCANFGFFDWTTATTTTERRRRQQQEKKNQRMNERMMLICAWSLSEWNNTIKLYIY